MLVKFNKAGRYNAGGVILLPGTNTVDPKMWLESRKHPHTAHKIEEDVIEELFDIDEVTEIAEGGDEKINTEADFDFLKTQKVPAARTLIKETFNVDLLKEWQKREDRVPVKQSLSKQIELMEEPLPTRDRGQKRQQSTGGKLDEIECKVTPGAQDD